jgi:putative ABC transport system substrate-binding protein
MPARAGAARLGDDTEQARRRAPDTGRAGERDGTAGGGGVGHAEDTIAVAAKTRLPAIFPFQRYVAAGGLLSYGASLGDLFARSAGYVDKILKGAKPADLPVEQPTTFELVVNLKTAQALGLTIPQSIIARADEVIE